MSERPSPLLPLPDLEACVPRPAEAGPVEEKVCAVGFFDLVGSTDRKLTQGHAAGVAAARIHNQTCKEVAARLRGTVVKELGDGILLAFDQPFDAVLAAENFRRALLDHTPYETRIGLSMGPVELATIDGRNDIMGAAVDRAAKVQTVGAANQIVLDGALAQAVRSRVVEHPDLQLAGPYEVPSPAALRGEPLFILKSAALPQLSETLMHRFQWMEDGRLEPDQKATYIATATEEIVEIGTTLETWASYFGEFKRSVYKEHVFARLAAGVVVRCYVLDPDCQLVAPYFATSPERSTRRSILDALRRLEGVKDEVARKGYSGRIELYTYRCPPLAYISAIDIGQPTEAAPRGRIISSPYLNGIPHADNPMLHFTWQENPVAFETHRQSIRWLTEHARPWQPRRRSWPFWSAIGLNREPAAR